MDQYCDHKKKIVSSMVVEVIRTFFFSLQENFTSTKKHKK